MLALHEIPEHARRAKATIAQRLVLKETRAPRWDAAYESDQLDAELAQRGIELIAPHRRDRKRKTQDGRPLRRYRRRWKVERLFAWLQNYRRVVGALRASRRELSGNGAPRLLPPPAAAFMRRLLASSDPFLQTARVFPGAPPVRLSISDDVYKPEHPIIQRVTACAANDKVTPCFVEAISYLVPGRPRRRCTGKHDSGGRKHLAGEVV